MSCGVNDKWTIDDSGGGGVADRRRRELQACRAEKRSCGRTAENVRREMAERRAELDAAVEAYERRRTELTARETAAHDRLALTLRNRSAAEWALEAARDRVDNELKARRTANTVRVYRLDVRCRQLHDRCRGFVVDALRPAGGDGTERQLTRPQRPAAAAQRRFFAVADGFGAAHRRESLRTSRSLHVLMAGYLRETAPKSAVSSPGRRRSLALLDAAEPARVLDELRVVQERCARIAERVRRRTGTADDRALPCRGPRAGDVDERPRQAGALCAARARLAAGLEYADRVRRLTDAAVSDVGRGRRELHALLCDACATCTGSDARQDGTALDAAGRLERACFALFARLDRAGTRWDDDADATRDVMTSCLRAVQTRRANAARRARDVAYRVDDFHKAVGRLLVAATPIAPRKSGRAAAPDDRSSRARDGKRESATADVKTCGGALRAARVVRGTTLVAPTSKTNVNETDVVPVTPLCPPSINAVEFV